MNAQKLVTFAFASKRRKLAMLTMVGVTGVGALFGSGGGDKTPATKPAAAVQTPATSAPATSPTTAVVAPSAEKCDGVNFNIAVAAGDKRDRDGDGIACEKN